MQTWFPAGSWLPKYQWSKNGVPDLVAAISVAALLIPESLGYASVAGVDGQVGLYAAILALVGYALFGGSRLMVFAAAGSVAAVSASVVGGLSGGDSDKAATLSALLALTTGAVFLLAGLARMGWVANFISKAIMAGLIFGMALQIIIGQFSKLLGLKSADGSTVEKLWTYLGEFDQWSGTAIAVGLGSLALIFALERFAPKIPGALTAVVVSSVIVAVFDPDLELVKKIPQGLPQFVDPTTLDSIDWGTLIAGGAIVALVGFSEGWGASNNIARKTHDSLDVNQEFRAYGVANLGAGLLGGMVTTGSLSKSSAAMAAGSKTQMSNLFLSALVILTLLVLAPAFQWLPETTLAAVVIAAMWNSAKPDELINFWRISRIDTAAGILTAIIVLTVDLMPALLAGMALSVVALVYNISFPTGAVLGRVQATGDFSASSLAIGQRTPDGFADAEPVPGMLIYRQSAPLIFSNAATFKNRLTNLLIEAAEADDLPHTVILDFEAVAYSDITGVETLKQFIAYCDRFDIEVILARVHRTTQVLMENAGMTDVEKHAADSISHAVAQAQVRHAQHDA